MKEVSGRRQLFDNDQDDDAGGGDRGGGDRDDGEFNFSGQILGLALS